jgi:hypothetical protein
MGRIQAEERLLLYDTMVGAGGRTLKEDGHRDWKRRLEAMAGVVRPSRKPRNVEELKRVASGKGR